MRITHIQGGDSMGGAALVFNSMAFILIILGAYIWRTRAIGLVAGFESGKITDPDALTRCVGVNLIIMGALILAGNFLGVLFPEVSMIYKLGLALAVIAVFTFRAMRQCRKFEKEEK
ncbi:MAG: DUF3784 domain-containing protein [Candidatus Latescibacterota bacterium]